MVTTKASSFLLLDTEKKFILQHRTDDAPTLPGYWALFGGRLENNETPLECVLRESKEELEGIILENLKFITKYDVNCTECTMEVYVYTAKLNYNLTRLRQIQREGQGLGLYHFKELTTLKIHNEQYKILGDLYDKKIIS